jgi:hypothetical protein
MKRTDLCAIMLLFVSFCFATSCSKMEEETNAFTQNELKDHITISIQNPEDVIDALCYDPRNVNPAAICPANIDPVCACGVITFGNACTARAYGFQNVTKGSCVEQKCYNQAVGRVLYSTLTCKDEEKFVCGCNGVTYKNKCEALRRGVLASTTGKCEYGTDINLDDLIEDGCFDPRKIEIVTACPQVFAPVCACGVIQFGNGCQAEAAGFQNYEEGGCVENRCQSNTVKKFFSNFRFNCNAFEPKVCGCDGEDYDSWCHALVSGVLAWTPGPCNNPDEIIEDLITIQN